MGSIGAAIFVVLITILGDVVKNPAGGAIIKNWLKDVHYHHWIGKGIWAGIVMVVFGLFSFIFKSVPTIESIRKLVKVLSWVLVLGSVALLAFFILEYFHLL